ncbi:MAG: hypothetical protein BMS9Abin32_230 [Gammaproteobacteria bacterium]|nr:MAG: hypothetical protein BMS9Abin32_230 [Gammaproteobacteria bacterium]
MARRARCSTGKTTLPADRAGYPAARRRLAAVVLLLLVSSAGSAEVPAQAAAASHDIGFTVERSGGRLLLRGAISSTAHEAILRQTAARLYAGDKLEFDLQWRAQLPAGWALLTEMMLRAVATTRFASAALDADGVTVRGLGSDQAAWRLARQGLEKSLLPGMQLHSEFTLLDQKLSFRQLCERLFAAAVSGRQPRFATSSAVLAASAYALLDELVEIAADCPSAVITVTGHTDATGNEVLNRKISLARAQTVVQYMLGRGADPARLAAVGAGSSAPRYPNDTAASRRGNRRIEFGVRLP